MPVPPTPLDGWVDHASSSEYGKAGRSAPGRGGASADSPLCCCPRPPAPGRPHRGRAAERASRSMPRAQTCLLDTSRPLARAWRPTLGGKNGGLPAQAKRKNKSDRAAIDARTPTARGRPTLERDPWTRRWPCGAPGASQHGTPLGDASCGRRERVGTAHPFLLGKQPSDGPPPARTTRGPAARSFFPFHASVLVVHGPANAHLRVRLMAHEAFRALLDDLRLGQRLHHGGRAFSCPWLGKKWMKE
jgi:hypothetical protein